VAGSKQNSSSGFPLPNNVARSWRGKNAILADEKLLHAIGSSYLGNQLDHLGVPEAAVTANDEE